MGVDTGLLEIEQMVRGDDFPHHLMAGKARGILTRQNIMKPYVEHILQYVDRSQLKPVKIVVNPGNGGAGAVLDELEKYVPFPIMNRMERSLTVFPIRCWKKTANVLWKRC